VALRSALIQHHQHLAVRAQGDRRPHQFEESARDLPGQPLLRRDETEPWQVDGVTGDDRLVVADVPDPLFSRHERVQAEVAADRHVAGRRPPHLAIAGGRIDATHETLQVQRVRVRAGDPARQIDGIPVDRDFDGAQRFSLPLLGGLHQGVGDGIGQLVRMSGKDPLGRTEDGVVHGPGPQASRSSVIDASAWRSSGSRLMCAPM
jgi:hypothetical protein